jgi:hypothetical protein
MSALQIAEMIRQKLASAEAADTGLESDAPSISNLLDGATRRQIARLLNGRGIPF